MPLTSALVVSIAAFAVLNFWWLPRIVAARASTRSVVRAGTLALVQQLRNQALAAVIAYLALSAVILYGTFGGGVSVDAVAKGLARARSVRDGLTGFGSVWRGVTFVLAFTGLVTLAYRRARQRIDDTFGRRIEAEVKRLMELRSSDPEAWRELPETDEMRDAWERLQNAARAHDALSGSDNDYQEKTASLKERADEFYRVWLWLDLERRIDPAALAGTNEARGFGGRVLQAMGSRGLFDDLKSVGTLASRAAAVCFFLALVSLGAPGAARAVGGRADSLRNLQIEMTLAETQGRLAAIPATADSLSSSSTLDAHTARAAAYVARAFERRWVASVAQSGPTTYEHATQDARAAVTRALVLESTSVPDHANVAAASDQSAAARTVDQLQPGVGARFEADLRKTPLGRSRLEQLVRDHIATYSDAVEPWTLHEMMVGDLLDKILDAAIPSDDSDLLNPVVKAVREGAGKMIERAYTIAANRFAVDLASGQSLEPALKAVANAGPAIPDSSLAAIRRTLSAELDPAALLERATRISTERFGSAGDSAHQAGIENVRRAFGEAKDFGEGFPGDRPDSLADLTATFASEFPAVGDNRKFIRDTLLAQWVPPAGQATSQATEVRRTRATNFTQLQNYSRVGGILFGRTADSGANPEVTDLRWALRPGGVALTLQTKQGRRVDLADLSPRVVHHALAYAVDGRLAVVTILNTPFPDLQQILVHPTLQDTAFGNLVVDADKWIFDYIRPTRLEARKDAFFREHSAEAELYRLARNAFAGDAVTPRLEDAAKRPLSSLGMTVDSLWQHAAFDARVVGAIKACRQKEGYFLSCVSDAGKASDARKAGAAPIPAAPSDSAASQIREAPFRLDPDLAFLREGSADDRKWPLELSIHVTLADTEAIESDRDLSDAIAKTVLEGIARDQRSAALAELQQFVVLQRLFRLGFQGGLGPAFPVDRLADLARDTRGFDEIRPTARWNDVPVNRGVIEKYYAAELRMAIGVLRSSEHKQDAANEIAALEACVILISNSSAPGSIPPETWDRTCSIPASLRDEFVALGRAVSELRKLRTNLGTR